MSRKEEQAGKDHIEQGEAWQPHSSHRNLRTDLVSDYYGCNIKEAAQKWQTF